MAVVSLYMSDRDESKTFTDKKEADNYDKMLELAENVSLWMEKEIAGLSEEQVESIGLLIADNKEILSKALKGKSELLLKIGSDEDEEKVTPISASA
ncbi:YebG family protein [Aliikangiella sp. IMCC44359]|uniref:YebG family protein n=1 Tax=Aliikangiella sp. IMCC44359 TaxID=3459125 RepID=UPI00403AA4F2